MLWHLTCLYVNINKLPDNEHIVILQTARSLINSVFIYYLVHTMYKVVTTERLHNYT